MYRRYNHRGYGNIRQEQIVHFQGQDSWRDFTDVDYAAVARASGLEGVRVDNADAFTEALRRAFASGKSWLVEVLIDRDVNAWTYPLLRRYEIGD